MFAGITHKIIVLLSLHYLVHISLVIYLIFVGCSLPAIGILVIPGKSIKVKSGHVYEYIVKIIGSSTIFFLEPATLSVKSSIVFLTVEKSLNFLSG